MTDIELIDLILKSNKPSDIFPDDWKKLYLTYSKLIHPDYNSNSLAAEAMSKMNMYKDMLENGIQYTDETGDFKIFSKKIEYIITDANKKLINKSVANYKKLMSKKDSASLNFHKYMPESMTIVDNKLTIGLKDRAVPLTNNKLPQIHVNWILSRMFEFSLWLRQINYSHLGLNPTTVFAVPETHGIIVISYYHLTELDNKVQTISAKYKTWYPTNLFTQKLATPDIDLELCKKTAIYLLGDKSAAGTKLKADKEVNQEFLNFILTKHQNTNDDYLKYRELLKKNFEKKFYPLSL
jgi:hypothetical protein